MYNISNIATRDSILNLANLLPVFSQALATCTVSSGWENGLAETYDKTRFFLSIVDVTTHYENRNRVCLSVLFLLLVLYVCI